MRNISIIFKRLELKKDIYLKYYLFGKDIAFYVRNPKDMVTIYVQFDDNKSRRISDLPQTVQWIQERQGISSAFGSADPALTASSAGPALIRAEKGRSWKPSNQSPKSHVSN